MWQRAGIGPPKSCSTPRYFFFFARARPPCCSGRYLPRIPTHPCPSPTPQAYSFAMDMWAVGCILGEMLTNRPMFPGKNYVEQLSVIVRQLGKPGPHECTWISSDRSREYVLSLPPSPKADFAAMFPTSSPQARDLMTRLLSLDPSQRITAAEALGHPYLAVRR
jgi:p38 MAP kinase